jgi:hypothetical protein
VSESDKLLRLQNDVIDGTPNSSHTKEMPQNITTTPSITGTNPPCSNQNKVSGSAALIAHGRSLAPSDVVELFIQESYFLLVLFYIKKQEKLLPMLSKTVCS